MTTILACPDETELLALAMGESVPAAVTDHVDGCAMCRTRLDRLRVEVATLRQNHGLMTTPPSTELDPTMDHDDKPSDAGTTTDWSSADAAGTAGTDRLGPEAVAAARAAAEGQGALPGVIGKYKIVRWIDGGGEADVYRVFHVNLGNDMILKHSRRRVDASSQSGLVEEGRRLVELEHPNLVRIYDLDFHDDRPFLVMEYVHGRNLEDFARDEPVSTRSAASLVAKLAEVTAVAHRHGITHCDIKPKNILIDELGEPRLIDFGMAHLRHAWSDCTPSTWGGTVSYMAPEQARLEVDRIGPRSDIFALGGVLYFLLTGQAPYAGEIYEEVWDRARRCDFEAGALRAAKVPRGLARICLKAMAAEPADRYATAEALAGELESYRRRPVRLAALAGVVLLAAAAAAGWRLWPAHQEGQRHSVVIPPLSGELNLLIYDQNNPGRQRVALSDVGAMPLKAEDLIRVEAKLNRPAYLYLIWIDSEGAPIPVYPWKPDRWDELAEPERPVAQVARPQKENVFSPIKKGAPGMETLLLLARETPLPPGLNLRELVTGLPQARFKDARTLVWFDDWSLVEGNKSREGAGAAHDAVVTARDRGPEFFVEVEVQDPILQSQRLLKERLKIHFSMMRAVSFANKGG